MKQPAFLGPRLRTLRKERNLTQRELAKKSGISVNAVSLIERNEISPSVSTLQSLAGALNVKLSYFFADEEQIGVIHIVSADRPLMESGGVTIGGVGSRLKGQQHEPYFIILQPNSGSGNQDVVHSGHELVYCVAGQIEYEIDKKTYLLNPGDILLFEARLPHRWHNATANESQMLLILESSNDDPNESSRRHFPDYPSLSHLG